MNQLHVQVQVCRCSSSVKSKYVLSVLKFLLLSQTPSKNRDLLDHMSIDTIAIEWSESCTHIFEKHWKNRNPSWQFWPIFWGGVTSTGELPELDWKSWTSNVWTYHIWTPNWEAQKGRRWLEVQLGPPQTVRTRKGNLSKIKHPDFAKESQNKQLKGNEYEYYTVTTQLHSYG